MFFTQKSKTTVAVIAMVLSLSLFLCSCGAKKEKPAAIYIADDAGNIYSEMSEGLFSYFASSQKSYYLMSFIGKQAYAEKASQYDTPEFWDQIDSEGEVSLGDYVYDEAVIGEAKKLLACEYIFDVVNGLETPDEVNKKIDETVKSLEKSLGSSAALENYLLTFGADIEDLRRYEMLEYKRSLLKNYIFGEDGIAPVPEESIKAYFEDNYAIVKHILINDAYVTKDDGSQRSLTAEELAEKTELIASINARISAGESFEALAEEYKDGDAYGYEANPSGYFVTDNNKYLKEFQSAALEMKENEVRTVKTAYGTHIMKKYPMNSELYKEYDDVYNEIKAAIEAQIFDASIEEYYENITLNDSIVDSYSIVSLPLIN